MIRQLAARGYTSAAQELAFIHLCGLPKKASDESTINIIRTVSDALPAECPEVLLPYRKWILERAVVPDIPETERIRERLAAYKKAAAEDPRIFEEPDDIEAPSFATEKPAIRKRKEPPPQAGYSPRHLEVPASGMYMQGVPPQIQVYSFPAEEELTMRPIDRGLSVQQRTRASMRPSGQTFPPFVQSGGASTAAVFDRLLAASPDARLTDGSLQVCVIFSLAKDVYGYRDALEFVSPDELVELINAFDKLSVDSARVELALCVMGGYLVKGIQHPPQKSCFA
ncbi:hypothetical protein C7T35_31270 [Variovorax sp. WS11]|uniref:hypothetical protein n=1 Tax=Variovorax sp. WS11 TaxID=1105204 RepID=UPI000D2B262E|nr:hypothetical protein [Variovorax sp. WS11]NDZ15841.1 hypothetical protein [Variovorax sp. WS11]PSL80656.1 hypothetical protein C7T35_31270 [Variovorax sp. WS11]